MRKEMRDELVFQILLMTASVILSGLLYWIVMTPQWKRQQMALRMKAAMENGADRARELTGKEVLEIKEFAQQISAWDHAQRALFRNKKKDQSNASEGQLGMETCSDTEESG